MTSALVPLADGCEEMEAVILIDVLRRAGWEVVAAGLASGPVTGSRGVRLVADADWAEVEPTAFDVLVLPGGGPGTERLRADRRVLDALRAHHAAGRIVAAICAAPLVLQAAGLLDGKEATCHPGVADALTRARHVDRPVVWTGHIATSQGPGTAFAFALALVERIDGPDAARRIAREMVLPDRD